MKAFPETATRFVKRAKATLTEIPQLLLYDEGLTISYRAAEVDPLKRVYPIL